MIPSLFRRRARARALPSRITGIAAATLLLALGAFEATADVRLAPLFSDGAVLQQKKPVTVWGLADPGENVEVSFASQSARTTADAKGHWSVMLEAMDANAQPQSLTVKGKNTVRVENVLVGEVWLCSGQSNMEWDVRRSTNASREIAQANYPLIRQIKIDRTAADFPMNDAPGAWQVCTPETVGNFTAVGYYFAVNLYSQLGVPVGLINSSWGGTQIEAWIEAEALTGVSSNDLIQQRWQERLAAYPAAMQKFETDTAKWQADRAKAAQDGTQFTRRAPRRPEGPGSRWLPSALFNGMIAPLAPYTLSGVLWYQGETNASRHTEYAELFKTMIEQWRASFKQEDLPFYFVQLANFDRRADATGSEWAYLREAQAAALELPNTGMAVAIDIGEANDIHPRNKQEVGRRLALLALRDVYGRDVTAQGPRFKDAAYEGNRAIVHFTHADGLNSDDQPLTGFVIAGSDQIFYPAEATVAGDTVVLTAPQVQSPVAVRYGWANYPKPDATLRNAAQLPAEPFRTDTW